jgi:UDP-2,3-diacylglucosamine hydrolase
MEVEKGKLIYFLSDFHLGAPNHADSLQRERKIVAFLESIRSQAAEIFIVGDMFDFWFKYVTPKGYVRLLGKLAEITDSGIPVHFFVGNHDMWMNDYLEKELNIRVYDEPKTFERNGKRFFIGHGDGLGPNDHGYKFLKKVFRNRICQRLFGFLHPYLGIGLANFFSQSSRKKTGNSDEIFLGEENEWLVIFSRQTLAKEHYDYFIFGHRHLPMDIALTNKSHYINLGDWIRYFTYAEFDGRGTQLKKLNDN